MVVEDALTYLAVVENQRLELLCRPINTAGRMTLLAIARPLKMALSGFVPVVEHIGSTSLGDITAERIIDILVGLQEEQSLDVVVIPLLDAGYTYSEKFNAGMPYRRFFVAMVELTDIPLPSILGDEDELTFGRDYDSIANIHVMTKGNYHWIRHLAFRDYPRTHPEVRKSCEALKLTIAEIEFADPLEYNTPSSRRRRWLGSSGYMESKSKVTWPELPC